MSAPKVDIGGREISQVFVITQMIVVLDERIDLSFEIAGQIVVFQQDPVLRGLVPSLDLALGLRMVGSATDMLHAPIIEPLGHFLPALKRVKRSAVVGYVAVHNMRPIWAASRGSAGSAGDCCSRMPIYLTRS